MLSAMFLTMAVYFFEESFGYFHRVPKFIIGAVMVITTFFAMLSYDGLVVAPVIVLIIGLSREQKNKWLWGGLLLIPLYLFMRHSAGALAPQGDYGYKTSTVFINSVVNSVGYAIASFGGPKVVDYWMTVRSMLRQYVKEISVAVAVIGAIVVFFVVTLREKLRMFRGSLVWIAAFFISLAAYAPLGGMADRYTYIPSIFLIIAVVLACSQILHNTKRLWVSVILLLLFVLLTSWNVREVLRVGDDWIKASNTAQQALAVIKEETFPPKDYKTFFFINTPIRYGSAWIFPTGLNDAIWHMYRESPYRIIPARTLEEAFEYPIHKGDREVFIFENYQLKRGIRAEVVIPTDTTKKK